MRRGNYKAFVWASGAAMVGIAWAQTVQTKQGLTVTFKTERKVAAESDVTFQFQITDGNGNPLQGLRPAAWLDRKSARPAPDSCTRKVASFVSNSLLSVPAVDLNTWYVLAMNEDASISVVNPRFGFGGSQLLTTVLLDSPAGDWALTDDGRTIFVTMPKSRRVAVVDTAAWKVSARLDLPSTPQTIALASDQRTIWVTHRDGVIAYERETLRPSATIATAAGAHEIAISADSRFLFLTSFADGGVTVIDAASKREIARVATGKEPVSVAFSELSRTAFVANQGSGNIAVVDTAGRLITSIPADPGVRQLRSAPGGRFVFGVNPEKEKTYIIDAAANRIVQSATIRGAPDQVTFTNNLAYLRRRDTATVAMIPLERIGTPAAPIPVVEFPGGRAPFGKGALASAADSIVAVPGANAVLVANPADRVVYYYQEGMAAPSGQIKGYGHEPRALVIVDRGLEERGRGLYETSGRIQQPGRYDVVFFLDSPRLVQCFDLEVAPAPGSAPPPREISLRTLPDAPALHPGAPSSVRFQVLDAASRQPITKLADLRALVFLQPGVWQTRQTVAESAPGVYEVQFTPPSSGTYQIYFESPAAGLRYNSPHRLTFMIPETQERISQ